MAYRNIQVEPFMPYEQNGGSALAISGTDFVVVGADTRLSSGVSIFSRHQSKVNELTNKAVIATTGCFCDGQTLFNDIRERVEDYTTSHMKSMTTESLSQMVSILMYNRRFLPYNVSNIVAGLDVNGKGAAYSYDSLGHYQQHPFCSIGTAGVIMMPILDALIENSIEYCFKKSARQSAQTLLLAEKIIEEAFKAAAERDVYTGDKLEITSITSSGIAVKEISLPKD